MIEIRSIQIGRSKVKLYWDSETKILSTPGYDVEAELIASKMAGTEIEIVPEFVYCVTQEVRTRPLDEIISEVNSILPVGKIPLDKRYDRLEDLGPSALSLIGRLTNIKMLETVCVCPKASGLTLERIAKNYRWKGSIASCLSRARNTPPRVLESLVSGSNYISCEEIASHPNLDYKGALAVLNWPNNNKDKREQEYVLFSLAAHWKGDSRIWDTLLTMDENEREGLAKNPHLPMNYLSILLDDKSPLVHAMLARRGDVPEFLPVLFKDKADCVQISLAQNILTPPELLARLSRNQAYGIHVAKNPSTPTECLRELSKSPLPDVRKMTLFNPFSPPQVLENLSNDPIPSLRMQAIISLRDIAHLKVRKNVESIEV